MHEFLRSSTRAFNALTSSISSQPLVNRMSSSLRAVLALIALGAIWGLTPAMAKLAMAEGMRPLGVAALAAGLSAVTLLMVAWWRGDTPRWTRAHLLHYGAGGLIGLALANLFAFTGLTRAPAGLFALIVPLSGLLSMVFFAMAGLERLTARGLFGTTLGITGVALAMSPGAALPDPSLLPWAALMLGTPVCYALANLLSVKLAPPSLSPLAGAAGTVTGATVSAVLIALPFGHLGPPPSAGIAGLLLAQGVLTAAAYLIYFRLLFRRGGVFTSQVSYLITLAGLVWGFLFFAEVPGLLTMPAAALIFAGVLLVSTAKPR
jgi:drug/metabolite transporter (DMT)-like permease